MKCGRYGSCSIPPLSDRRYGPIISSATPCYVDGGLTYHKSVSTVRLFFLPPVFPKGPMEKMRNVEKYEVEGNQLWEQNNL